MITKFQDDIKSEETIMKPMTEEQLQKNLKKALNSLVDKVQMIEYYLHSFILFYKNIIIKLINLIIILI